MTAHYPAITVLALFMSTAVAVRVSDPIGGRSAGVRAWAALRPEAVTTVPAAC